MTRLEDNNNNNVEELQGEVERLKKSIKGKQNKKILTCGTCFLFVLLLILFLGSLGAFALAKSGLVTVPFFTEKFYQEPKPSHLVTAEALTENDVYNSLQKAITGQALVQKKTKDFEVNLELSEEQLTTLIRAELGKSGNYNKIDYLQLAVLADNCELFLKTKEPPNLFLTFNIKPIIKDGKLELETSRIKIGDLTLPKFTGNFLLFLAKSPLNSILGSFNNLGQIQKINLQPRLITILLLIKSLNLK